MCKFTNRLFVFPLLLLTLLCSGALLQAAGVARRLRGGGGGGSKRAGAEERLSIVDLLPSTDYDYNYDLDYDQRQKGSDNMRLKMDGVFIALPAQDANADELWEELSEDLLQSFVKSRSSTVAPEHSHLSYKSAAAKLHNSTAERNSEPLIVEIPAPKRDLEGLGAAAAKHEARSADLPGAERSGGVVSDANVPGNSRARSPGKRHFYSLFSLIKRLRRN